MQKGFFAGSLAALAIAVATPAHASGQDEARAAVERGEIRPLGEVIAAAKARAPGEVVKVELERDDGRWVYEIKILTQGGERREFEIDAKSLEILDED